MNEVLNLENKEIEDDFDDDNAASQGQVEGRIAQVPPRNNIIPRNCFHKFRIPNSIEIKCEMEDVFQDKSKIL